MQANTPDTRVADAINRVLEAEHASAAAIDAAQAAAQARIEAARETRRAILETARDRIVRLHERAHARLNEQLLALDAHAAASTSDDAALEAIADAAISCMAARLTSDTVA
jgi:uncharacterized ferritin-like protein (DUF455 family)